VLDGNPQMLRDLATTTNFGFRRAIILVVWYIADNWFCCLILGVGFRGQAISDEDIAKIECLRVVVMATNFGTNIAITGLV